MKAVKTPDLSGHAGRSCDGHIETGAFFPGTGADGIEWRELRFSSF